MSISTFLWREGSQGAENGWRLNGYSHFDAVSNGHHLAHDILEHLPGGMRHGQIADELMALGARMYIRVASGWWAGVRTALPPRIQLGLDLYNLVEEMQKGAVAPAAIEQAPLASVQGESCIAAALEYAMVFADWVSTSPCSTIAN